MKNRKNIILLIIIFCVISVITVCLTFSKYIYNSVLGYYLQSRGFYFSSDNLDINNKKNSILTWDGSNIKFEIKNSENASLVSEYDISYKVSCEILNNEKEYLSCNLNNTGQSTYSGKLTGTSKCIDPNGEKEVGDLIKSECELGGYTWKKEITTKEIYFNIDLTDETKSIDEVSVQVTVESTHPYKKTLKGVFNLNLAEEEAGHEIYYEDFDEYNQITILNKSDEDSCFNISFDETKNIYNNFSNDVVDTLTTEDKTINKIKVKIKKQASSMFDFYKIKPEEVYSIDDFILEEIEC